MKNSVEQIKTSMQLRHEGVSAAQITRKVRQGALVKIRANAYVHAGVWESWDETARVRARQIAFIKTNPGYVLSHVSAALWWGAPLLRLPQRVWVSHPSNHVRSRPGVQVVRSRPAVCAEADGRVKYSGAYGDGEDVAYRELGRQRELEALEYRVVRVRWRELVYEPEVLRACLLAAGVR